MQELKLAEDVFDALSNGKRCTIRKGRRNIELGNLLFTSTEKDRKQVVDVKSVLYCSLFDIPKKYVINDGFSDHNDMLEQMKRFYPDISSDTECTIVDFDM